MGALCARHRNIRFELLRMFTQCFSAELSEKTLKLKSLFKHKMLVFSRDSYSNGWDISKKPQNRILRQTASIIVCDMWVPNVRCGLYAGPRNLKSLEKIVPKTSITLEQKCDRFCDFDEIQPVPWFQWRHQFVNCCFSGFRIFCSARGGKLAGCSPVHLTQTVSTVPTRNFPFLRLLPAGSSSDEKSLLVLTLFDAEVSRK